MPSLPQRPIAVWLLICCGMVVVMALIGAITRLTESGLSITDWNPILGAVPPLNDAEWEKQFDAYKLIPQYQVLNRGMTIDEFKYIFFWEWLHRLWGRLIGLVFALPLLWFAIRRKIDRPLALKLLGLLALGGLQGFVGWFMVQSGLETRTSVSPYRLAMHLFMALLLYALMFWTALGLWPLTHEQVAARSLRKQGWFTLCLLIVTMIWGAFVAGLHAGEAYNTWPLMEGDVLPSAAFTILPKWLNIFENLALVQFIHRWLGPLTMIVIWMWVARCLRSPYIHDKRWPFSLGIMAIVQVTLGLSTLLTHVDIMLATAHQAGAIALLTLVLVNLKRMSVSSR